MQKFPIAGTTLRAIALTGLLMSACGDPKTDSPTTPSQPAVSSVSITGPASVAPGQSVQFAAVLRFPDGTSKSVLTANNLRWRTSNASILQVNATSGLVTATQLRGDATLSADWTSPSRTSSREVTVLPDGTFRVTGQITEANVTSVNIAGARVEAIPGGPVATTDATGQYKLYGVSADVTIRVTADGYLPAERSLQLSGPATQNIQLGLSGPPLMVQGSYTLALDLAGACPGTRPLAAALQHRTYEAVVSQVGSQVDVLLTEPRFRLNSINRGNRFFGRTTAASVVFTIEGFNDYYYPYYGPTAYPNIAERLPDGTYFMPSGTATATVSPTGLSGQMTNSFLAQYSSTFPPGAFVGSCSGPLQFTLTRR